MTDGPTALGAYLRARRELTQPEDVGMHRDAHRRVKGLRREELAALAGISSDYYLRLEQGHDHQPSDQVLLALGRALRLDDAAVAYLVRIARPEASRSDRAARVSRVDQSLVDLLDQWAHTPAFIIDRNQDIVLSNPLAVAFGGGYMDLGNNLVLTAFEPILRETAPDWHTLALDRVAALRYHADPADPRLQEIVGTLSLGDEQFRQMWARHDARPATTGRIRNFIDGIGLIELRFQHLTVPGSAGYTLSTFFGEPGTRATAALAYLAAQLEARDSNTRFSA